MEVVTIGRKLFVCGVCYNPPRPLYNQSNLVKLISDDIDLIFSKFPDAILCLAGDFNQLDLTALTVDYGLTKVNKLPTHGDNVLDNFLTGATYLTVLFWIQP